MTLLRLPRRPRRTHAVRRVGPVAAVLLLLATAAPVVPGHADAAGPRQRVRVPHQEKGPSPVPTGPPAPAVYRVATDQKVIALTFDDGWDASRCLAIGSVLDRYRIPATFFPNAMYVRRSPEIWRSLGARFPIGNHTSHHLDLRDLTNAEIARELEHDRKTIEGITGRPMVPLLRPPYGAFNERVARVASGMGYRHIVLWDVSDGDTGPRATERGSAIAALGGEAGSIVLMHCGPALTPRMLPVVIERYACEGFRFGTVEELLRGSAGHAARVDCPPLPLPPRIHRRPPSPAPSTDPAVDSSPGPLPSAVPLRPSPLPTDEVPASPAASDGSMASPAPTSEPILLRDLPVLLASWADGVREQLARLGAALLPGSSPSVPAPSVPAPSVPAPLVPAPSVPAPLVPAPSVPAAQPSLPPRLPAPTGTPPGG